MPYNVSFISLGCAKNQVNCEQMMATVQHAGHNVVLSPEGADVAVVNTCGFLASACEEAIDNILEMAELKKEGKLKKIIVTGCMAQRYKDDVLRELPEVDAVLGTGSYGDIADAVAEVMDQGLRPCHLGNIHTAGQSGERILSTAPWYAYLRIAEGCDNCCSYCAIPSIRGRFRSRPMESVLAEARTLADKGVRELVVVAQDTTRYGQDLYGEYRLAALLRELAKIKEFRWIRVLYAYPERITDELLEVIAENDNIAKYLDIPMQHCDKDILRAMNRPGDRQELEAIIARVREKVPGITLRTSLIAGFPGETQENFEHLCEFVKEARFERLGCFAYSQEEGTRGAGGPDRRAGPHRPGRNGHGGGNDHYGTDERGKNRQLHPLCGGGI